MSPSGITRQRVTWWARSTWSTRRSSSAATPDTAGTARTVAGRASRPAGRGTGTVSPPRAAGPARRPRAGAYRPADRGAAAGRVVRAAAVPLRQPRLGRRALRRRADPAVRHAVRLRARRRRGRRPVRLRPHTRAGCRPHPRLHVVQRLVGPGPAGARVPVPDGPVEVQGRRHHPRPLAGDRRRGGRPGRGRPAGAAHRGAAQRRAHRRGRHLEHGLVLHRPGRPCLARHRRPPR